jgi:hypothetical protein
MYLEGYIFYSALVILAVFLIYKYSVVLRYDRMNKNSIFFDPTSRHMSTIIRHAHTVYWVVYNKMMRPIGVVVVRNVTYVARGAKRSVNDIRTGRKRLGTMIEKKGDASGYMQNVLNKNDDIHESEY